MGDFWEGDTIRQGGRNESEIAVKRETTVEIGALCTYFMLFFLLS